MPNVNKAADPLGWVVIGAQQGPCHHVLSPTDLTVNLVRNQNESRMNLSPWTCPNH